MTGIGVAARELFAAVTMPGAGEALGLEGWLDALSETQDVLNVLAGVQAVAMAQVAAFDRDDEVGFGPRTHRGLGHCAVDAPDLVAARVGCSAQAASSRVGVAVAQVTSMPAVVAAMGAGRVDGFRAAVVADELADAPAEVRAQVTAELDRSGRLACESAGPLRRRARRLLAECAPEVLAARAAGERERRGLHRSTASLGVEQWAAWLPVESSRPAWAVVTQVAQDYLRAGQADTLAQARADALTDLILGQATTTVVLHPTVPVEALTGREGGVPGVSDADGAGDELVPVSGYGTPGQSFVRRSHLDALAGLGGPSRRRSRRKDAAATVRGGAAARAVASVRVGECLAVDAGTGAVAGVLDLDRDLSHDQDSGGPVVVRSGARDGYRPSAIVERVVKMRDGRCRFPGCQIPVRFVDLDHVRAYDHDDPARGGPTAVINLACLCRRHHRIKQRPDWQVVLDPDGTMRWTDPSGRVRVSWPEDHRDTGPPPPSRQQPSRSRPDHPTRPVAVAPEPARDLDPAELEPYSLVEDQLVDLLLERGVDVPSQPSVHRTLPRPVHRRSRADRDHVDDDHDGDVYDGDASASRVCRIRPDLTHGITPTHAVVLHPDTIAEYAEQVWRRTAPPF